MTLKPLSIPPFTVTFTGTTRTEASSISRVEGPAQQHRYRVSHPGGWWLDLVLQEFDHGELDVSCLEYAPDTPLTLHRLARALRLGIRSTKEDPPRWHAQMYQARLKSKTPPSTDTNKKKATEAEVDEGAGFAVRPFLHALGGTLGTKEALLDADDRKRGDLTLIGAKGNRELMVAGYVVTRVLPLHREWTRL
jgi:hypothetical protein